MSFPKAMVTAQDLIGQELVGIYLARLSGRSSRYTLSFQSFPEIVCEGQTVNKVYDKAVSALDTIVAGYKKIGDILPPFEGDALES